MEGCEFARVGGWVSDEFRRSQLRRQDPERNDVLGVTLFDAPGEFPVAVARRQNVDPSAADFSATEGAAKPQDRAFAPVPPVREVLTAAVGAPTLCPCTAKLLWRLPVGNIHGTSVW
jgi:hypothetical protein